MSKKLWLLALLVTLLVALTNVAHATMTSRQNLSNNTADSSPQKGALFANLFAKVRLSISEIKTPPSGNFTPKKATSVSSEWLDKLGEMENCPTEGLIDSNGKKSYGRYCFQEATFLESVKRYKEEYNLLPYAEEAEFNNWLSDEKFQRKLVEIIVIEEQDLVRGLPRYSYKWYTTIHKRGLGLAEIE